MAHTKHELPDAPAPSAADHPADPKPAPGAPALFPTAKALARRLVGLRRRARAVRAEVQGLERAERRRSRELLREAYELERRALAGLRSQRAMALAVRDARRISDRLDGLLGVVLPRNRLRPEDMLGLRRPVNLVVERFAPQGATRLRWPLQYDLYRFEILAESQYRFNALFDEKMRRTQACLDQLGVESDVLPDRKPLERPIDKHEGEYALPPRRRLPPPVAKKKG